MCKGHQIAAAIAVALVLVLAGCGCRKSEQAVVGIGSAQLYSDESLSGSTVALAEGTKLDIVSESAQGVEVQVPDGAKGWLRPYAVCRQEELERRRTADEVPQQVICLRNARDGMELYGGAVCIEDGEPVLSPRQGVWTDPTLAGKQIRIAGSKVVGDPEVLFVVKEQAREAAPTARLQPTLVMRGTAVIRTRSMSVACMFEDGSVAKLPTWAGHKASR